VSALFTHTNMQKLNQVKTRIEGHHYPLLIKQLKEARLKQNA
jgi:hypothetical protein